MAGFPPHTLVLSLFLPDKTREFELKKLRSSGRSFPKTVFGKLAYSRVCGKEIRDLKTETPKNTFAT